MDDARITTPDMLGNPLGRGKANALGLDAGNLLTSPMKRVGV